MLKVGHTGWKERGAQTQSTYSQRLNKLTRLDGWWVKQKQEPLPMAA